MLVSIHFVKDVDMKFMNIVYLLILQFLFENIELHIVLF